MFNCLHPSRAKAPKDQQAESIQSQCAEAPAKSPRMTGFQIAVHSLSYNTHNFTLAGT
jgi:hypothetical protein